MAEWVRVYTLDRKVLGSSPWIVSRQTSPGIRKISFTINYTVTMMHVGSFFQLFWLFGLF